MDIAWFRAFAQRCRERQSLPSVDAWVAAHNQPAPAANPAAKSARRTATARAALSDRNDARTAAGASGSGVNITFQLSRSSIDANNIFANSTLHDQAAATLASASQSYSGFSAIMSTEEGVALEKFQAYIEDFFAPHWLLTDNRVQEVRHELENHSKFVDDLVSVVVEGLTAAGGDAEAVERAEETVRNLSQRLASNNSVEEKLSLFSTFWLKRASSSDNVVYSIFYTELEARYQPNGKTEVLSSQVNTYTFTFTLNSALLIQNEASYNQLIKASVNDWLASHTI